MKNKKIIKLINNEKIARKISSTKACDRHSDDICYEKDYASCTVYSIDICTLDYKGCTNNSTDYCNTDIK